MVAEARSHGVPVLGAAQGLTGLLEDRFFDLSRVDLEPVRVAPSSVIGSSRRALNPEDDIRILETFKRRNVRWFFYTGGNGSMDTALRFHRLAGDAGYDLQVIGIPKTIDNDLMGTDHTPGHASCARFFAHAVRDIGADNRALPTPVVVVETLGRNAGWVVAGTAHARHHEHDAPHLIYFPEFGISADQLCADVEGVYARLGRCVVAVCEGQPDEKGEWFGADLNTLPGARDALPANLGHMLSRLIWSRTGLRARAEKPGLLGRSCQALVSEVDRDEAWRCGQAAMRLAMAGESGKMVSIRRVAGPLYRSEMVRVPLECVAGLERKFPAGWVNPARNDVQPGYLEWSRPIVGEIGELPAIT